LLAGTEASGGLLVYVASGGAEALLPAFSHAGFTRAAVNGMMKSDASRVAVGKN